MNDEALQAMERALRQAETRATRWEDRAMSLMVSVEDLMAALKEPGRYDTERIIGNAQTHLDDAREYLRHQHDDGSGNGAHG